MTIESVTYISDLNPLLPASGDVPSQGDDHIRNLKTGIVTTFPNITAAVTATHTELNYTVGLSSAAQTQLNLKAPLNSPAFTTTATLDGVTLATLGANTFTDLLTVTHPSSTARIIVNGITGQDASIFLRENNVNSMLLGNDASSNRAVLTKYDAVGSLISNMVFNETGGINVETGTFLVGGVNVATVGANTFTGNQTIDLSAGNAEFIIDTDDPTGLAGLVFRDGGAESADILYANNADELIIRHRVGGVNNVKIAIKSTGEVDVETGTFLVGGVNVATTAVTNLLAPKASPTLTGTPVAPTAAAGTNTTQLATTAFVQDAAGTFKGFSATLSSGEAIAAASIQPVNTTTVINLTEEDDAQTWFTPSTGKFQPDEAGEYWINACIYGTSLSAPIIGIVNKNGAERYRFPTALTSSGQYSGAGGCRVTMNGSTDYIEYTISGTDTSWTLAATSYFQAHKLGA